MPESIEVADDGATAIEVVVESMNAIEVYASGENLLEATTPAPLVLHAEYEGESTVEVRTAETDLIVVEGGERGPRGLTGPPGPTGGNYVHTQLAASAVWEIEHDLDMHPNVTVQDSAGSTVHGAIVYESRNRVVLMFSAAFAGTAYLS